MLLKKWRHAADVIQAPASGGRSVSREHGVTLRFNLAIGITVGGPRMERLTLDEQIEIACCLDMKEGIIRQHELFCKLFRAYREQRDKIESLEEWIKTLERQLNRYKEHINETQRLPKDRAGRNAGRVRGAESEIRHH